MFTVSFRRLGTLAVLALSLGLTACDSGSDEPTPTPTPTAPTFSIASIGGTLSDGTPGIAFFATPSEDVTIASVRIQSPVGALPPFNANNQLFLSGSPIGFQDAGNGYPRVSGTWTFTITGARSPSATPFTVTVTLPVAAKR